MVSLVTLYAVPVDALILDECAFGARGASIWLSRSTPHFLINVRFVQEGRRFGRPARVLFSSSRATVFRFDILAQGPVQVCSLFEHGANKAVI